MLKQIEGTKEYIMSISEAKNYLKLGDDSTDNGLIYDLIKTATSIIEHETGGLCIYEQTFEQKLTGGVEEIELLRQPVIGIPTVNYYEEFTTTTPEELQNLIDFRISGNVLYHKDGKFPKGREGDGYTITYKAGLFQNGSHTNSNNREIQLAKIAMLRIIGFLFENREEYAMQVDEGGWKVSYDGSLPIGIKRLIMPLHTGKGLI
jgi:hypothetical protein